MSPVLTALLDAGLVVVLGVLAVLPNSRLVTAVFRRVDRAEAARPLPAAEPAAAVEPSSPPTGDTPTAEPAAVPAPDTLQGAARVLRGGRWIGVLERTAVFASIVAGYPNGVAVTVAVKALARYPELKSTTSAAAERFIIGTFASVLWASGWAGLARWLMTFY